MLQVSFLKVRLVTIIQSFFIPPVLVICMFWG